MFKISQLRKNYQSTPLKKGDLHHSPFLQFEKWLEEAIQEKVVEPTAMILSTATPSGVPSSRVVLLKEWSSKGGIFFTNTSSQKAGELAQNPVASCLFWWKELERQIIIHGTVKKISPKKSFEYFTSRPRKSQIAAWVSMQGQPLSSKEVLETAFEALMKKWEGKTIPLPPHWGGYLITPTLFQFWQGRRDRLHDRFLYLKTKKNWTVQQLYP